VEYNKGHKNTLENLGAMSAGAVDEILFGLPEYAIKNLGGREAATKYIQEHEKAYKQGEGIGTVASMFLPVPGAAALKGAGLAAKGLKAAKAVDTAKDAGTLAKMGQMAAKGAASGAIESGVRGVTSEKKAADILRDIGYGTVGGAVGGSIAGAATKALPNLAEQLSKATGAQYRASRGLNTKDLTRAFNASNPAGAGASYRAQKAGDWVRDITDYAKTVKRGEGVVEGLSAKTSGIYKTMDNAWDKTFKGVSAKDIFTNAIDADEIAKLSETYGDDTAKQAYAYIMKQSGGKKGLAGIKNHLQDVIDTARTNSAIADNVELSSAIQDLSKSLRGKMDDIAIGAVEKQGGGKIDIAKLKKDYAMLKPLENMTTREELLTSKVGGGSPTSEKNAILAMLQGNAPSVGTGSLAGTAAALTQNQDDDALTKARNIALASIGGVAAGKASSALGSRLIGGLDTAAVKFAKSLPDVMSKGAIDVGTAVGGQAGSVIARQAVGEAAPSTPEEAEAAETGAEGGTESPAYKSKVLTKMQDYALERGVDPESEEFQQFAADVYAMTDGFSPDKIGAILYTDPEEQKAYLKALEVSRRLKTTMPGALQETGGGWFDGATEEEKIAKQTAVDQLGALVGDVAKTTGSEPAAKKQLTKILASKVDPERKAELVKTVLASYGVDVDEIEALGVV